MARFRQKTNLSKKTIIFCFILIAVALIAGYKVFTFQQQIVSAGLEGGEGSGEFLGDIFNFDVIDPTPPEPPPIPLCVTCVPPPPEPPPTPPEPPSPPPPPSPANNAACSGISAPGSVTVNQTFSANVIMNNNGTKVWNSDATPHNLGSQNPQDNTRWGLGRVGLPSGQVNPGQSASFSFTSTAPSTPGSYPFDWKMVEDGIEWFGQTCSKTITVNPILKAHIVLNPTAFTFNGVSGGATPAGQNLNISDTGNAVLNWTGSTNQNWCHLSSDSGTIAAGSSANVAVSVDAPSNVGSFNCVITISGDNADNSPQTASVLYNVTMSPPGNFSLTSGTIACNSVPLSWTAASGAQGYRILRGSSRVDISPYQPYTAQNFVDTSVSQNTTYLYQIEAYNAGGTNRSNAINVTTPYCPPIVSLLANPSSIFQGQSSTLTWTSANSTSCSASNGWIGSKALNGSEVVIPSPPPSVTYDLTCFGPGGSALSSATINITPLALPDWKEIIPR